MDKPIPEAVVRAEFEKFMERYGPHALRKDSSGRFWEPSTTQRLEAWQAGIEWATIALAAAQQQATLVNPHTGEPRDYRDVDSDPAGVLCVEPGAPLIAAQQQGQAVAWPTETKHVGGGDWEARTALCTHTMSEAQAKLWNACLAACKSATTAPPPSAPVGVERLADEWSAHAATPGIPTPVACAFYTCAQMLKATLARQPAAVAVDAGLAESLRHAANRWEREAEHHASGFADEYSSGQRHAYKSCALEMLAILDQPLATQHQDSEGGGHG